MSSNVAPYLPAATPAVKATRSTIELRRGATQIRVTRESVRTGRTWALFRRREPRLVLNGDVWALERRSYTGVTYEVLRSATRAELVQFAGMNVNPSTAAAVLRGEVIA